MNGCTGTRAAGSRSAAGRGARNLTLTTLLNAFLAQDTLRLTSIAEFDTDLQPWRPGAGDRRILPWNVAITARAVIPAAD